MTKDMDKTERDGKGSELEEGELPQSPSATNSLNHSPPAENTKVAVCKTYLNSEPSLPSLVVGTDIVAVNVASESSAQEVVISNDHLEATAGNIMAVEEAPFFLVVGRKGGRKVTTPH